MERFEKEFPETLNEKDEKELCRCFRRLLPLVPEQYRELLDEVDLKGKSADDVSARLGLSKNNLTVRLHRARKHLRKALTASCGACSVHGCVDCTCNDADHNLHGH